MTTQALKDNDRNTTVFMKAKKVLVRKSAFPKLSTNLIPILVTIPGYAYTKVTKELVAQV